MKAVKFFYPSFVRKALTFTIDDGNFKYDTMLLDILKPKGIKGTFNLCSNLHFGKEEYTRDFYSGYGVANHCKYHPLVNFDGVDIKIKDEEFDEASADPNYVYPVKEREGFFWVKWPSGWRHMVFDDDFCRCVRDGQRELKAIFGEDKIKDFVWPYREQNNDKVKETVRKTHRSARKTGCTFDLDGFAIPKDKYCWSYNANNQNLLEVMEKYDAYPDDGELKFFAFGVHSVDFERDGNWDDLRTFADKYGNRPKTYWYTTVEEVFDYEEAIGSLIITDKEIENPSNVSVYIEVGGEKYVIEAKGKISVS